MPALLSPSLNRRDFIAQSTAGALALGLTGSGASLAAAAAPKGPAPKASAPKAPAPLGLWPRAIVDKCYISNIWADGSHNGFPGIARVGDYYYVTFRHAATHAQGPAGSAKIFVIRSAATDLKKWAKVAEFTHEHDARDPLVFNNNGKVQVVFHSKEDYYTQSADGLTWSPPQELETEIPEPNAELKKILTSNRRWLFRIRRGPDGAFYSLGRCGIVPQQGAPGTFGLILFRSEDGVKFKAMHTYGGGPSAGMGAGRGTGHEADVAWGADGSLVCAIRDSRRDGVVVIGPAPHGPWRALGTGTMTFGGPALHRTKKGGMLVAARHVSQQPYALVRVSTVTPAGVDNPFIVPSGGDCAYQSFADGPGDSVLLAYYSSHEHPQLKGVGMNPANIYLAHLTLRHEAAT